MTPQVTQEDRIGVFARLSDLYHGFINRRYLVNSVIYMAGNLLAQALAFFALPVFTRYLSPADYGILSYTGSLVQIFFILSLLSLNSFVLRHYFELDNEEDRRELFGTIFIFLLPMNLVFLLLEFSILPHVFSLVAVKVAFHPYMAVALLDNSLEVVSVLPLAYYRVTANAWRYFWLISLKSVLSISLGLILVIGFDLGVMGRYYGSLATNAVFLFVYLNILFRISSFRFRITTITRGLRFSLPLVPTALAGMAFFSLDRIVLERYVSLAEMGIYSVALVLGTALAMVTKSFYLAIEPEMYALFSQEGYENKVVALKNRFLYGLIILGCVIIVFSKEIIRLAASPTFFNGYRIIPFFVIGMIFKGAELIASISLFALNKTRLQMVSYGVSLGVFVPSLFLLIPLLGAAGAAVALACSYAVLFLLSVRFVTRHSHIRWGARRDATLILAAASVSYGLMHIDAGSVWGSFFVKAGIVAAAGSMLAGRFWRGTKGAVSPA
ncbi:MAG: oligosaccharide flippase family protein [Deltaproteobacteria bacterium]|nr:oligosaccharide flippase family protein [Deltaproteobacteria bacterium]